MTFESSDRGGRRETERPINIGTSTTPSILSVPRVLEARDELRIARRSEVGIPDPDRIRFLRSAFRHSADYPGQPQ